MTSAAPAIFPLRSQSNLRRVRRPVLIAGALLLAASVAGAHFSPNDFFRSYLIGYLFFLGLTLGSMAYLMIQYLTGGAWGVVSRRVLEAATRTMPLLAILFIPIGCGISNLYPWARPEIVRHDPILLHRSSYMNVDFFLARAAIYLVIWTAFSFYLNRWSLEQDRNPRGQERRLAKLSVSGLILYLFSITFAAVDWTESLETSWASTMWGFMFIAAEGLTALCFLILVMAVLSRREPMSRVLKPDHFHDLGKMLLANLMLWAYFAFCQFLIVWSGNLTHEIQYYLPRMKTSWGWLGVALIVVQFLIPAMLLLNRDLKRNAYLLSGVAIIILVMRYFDVIWIVLPGYYDKGFRIQWMDVLT
ncbi:MAG: hypothetical protein ACRD4G_05245, partial [Bryobacteraceae bacterium]